MNTTIFDDLWDEDVKSRDNLMFNFKIIDEKDNIVLIKEPKKNRKYVFKTPDNVTLSEVGKYNEHYRDYLGNKMIIEVVPINGDEVPFLDYKHNGKYRSVAIGENVTANNIDDYIKEII